VLMEIPFDRRIAEAYSRGDMMVEVMPEWKDQFVKLYHRIDKLAGKKGKDNARTGCH